MRSNPGRLAFALAPALLLGAGCMDPATDDWTDQLVADGPCFRVDLFDGLDEETHAEILDLYGCVNRTGDFDALAPVVTALEGTSPMGDPGWRELARAVNALPAAGVDVFGLAGVLLEALRAPERPIDLAIDVALELITGEPAPASGPPADGVLAPLAGVVAPLAAVARADDLAPWIGETLAHPDTARWIRTVAGFAASVDPAVVGPVAALPADVAAARNATLDAENDRWAGASGDSLRDAFDAWVLAPEPGFPAVADELGLVLSDERIRTRLQSEVVRLGADGTLGRATDGLVWMSSVDPGGGALGAGEDSALHAFVRLLADANQPMDCSVDLLLFELEFSFGNLAVATLELIADVDAADLQTAGSIYGLLFGNGVGALVLEEAADLGVCPGLTQQVVADLAAVEVLAEPEAEDLLTAFVSLLDTLEEGTENQIPTLADLADHLYRAGAWPASEELIRDVGATALADDALALLPALAEPAAYGITAGTQPAADLQEALDLLAWLADTDPATGETGFARIDGLLATAGAHDGVWLAGQRAVALLGDPTSALGSGPGLVTGLLAADPDLVLLAAVAPVFSDPAIAEPALRLAETSGVAEALLAGEAEVGQAEPPLGLLARVLSDGTFTDLLQVIDLAVGLL